MGPDKPHSKKMSLFDCSAVDNDDDSSLKFVLDDEESEITQQNHEITTNHVLQDVSMENLLEVFSPSYPLSSAFLPNQEDPYEIILDVEKNILAFSKKFNEISTAVDSFKAGHNYQHSDLIELENGCKKCLEEWILALEKLGSIQLEDFQIVEKSKRENLVNHTNSLMDLANNLIPKIETLKTNVVLQQGM